MLKRPGEIVAAVSIDGLEKAEGDPDVHRKDVEVSPEHGVEDGTENGAGAEDEDFGGVRIFGGETEGSGVLVVDLVDMFIERAPVECLVCCGEKERREVSRGEDPKEPKGRGTYRRSGTCLRTQRRKLSEEG